LEGIPSSILGFHAQQAIEKLIKALLAQLSVPFELTHNLADCKLPWKRLAKHYRPRRWP